MATIILRRPEELTERDRLEALNRKRARQGMALLVVHENCVCGCGKQVPQQGREGIMRFVVNEKHYQRMLDRTAKKVAAMKRDHLI